MKKFTAILYGALAVISLLCGQARATTYYVNAASGRDTNAGTSTTAPLLTMAKAASLTKPGDVVNVMNGTYAPFTITRSGTEGAWITYQAGTGQHPVILKNGTAWDGVDIEASYITLSRLTIQGNAKSITYAQANAASTNNTTTNGHCLSSSKTSHHVKILNNVMEYCPGGGIMFLGDYGWIHGNTVHHNAYWSHNAESGIKVVGANPLSTPGNVYVDSNLVYSNQAFVCNRAIHNPCRVTDGQGIIVDYNIAANPPGYSGRIEIFNNIVYNNGGWGIVTYRSQHIDIYNNTTWHNGLSVYEPAPYTAGGGEILIALSTDIVVENNILDSTVVNFGVTGDSTNVTWDYNVIYNATAPARPIGPHDMILDPMFETWFQPPQAFKQQEGGAGVGAGTDTLVPPTDYAGQPRWPARIDCGAWRWN